MDTAMERHSFAWVYFVSFVVVGTFVVINLFIAIIINSLDDTKRDRALEGGGPVSRQDLVRELRATRETLERLEERLNVDDPRHEGNR